MPTDPQEMIRNEDEQSEDEHEENSEIEYVASELHKLEKLNFTFTSIVIVDFYSRCLIADIGFIGTFCDFSKYYRELNNVVEERKNVFGADNEVKALIEALQEMTCDPLWKTNGGIQEWLHGRVA
ncbi:hypothetical protein ACH5RR_006529 [Cinchona calisaya]|uniref:Uncharacterized protein n=1 Tax=Cinchona calisaya TaxID=153742 RepID=A0ABD3AP98_9GENT